jgi:hypothetical protein
MFLNFQQDDNIVDVQNCEMGASLVHSGEVTEA